MTKVFHACVTTIEDVGTSLLHWSVVKSNVTKIRPVMMNPELIHQHGGLAIAAHVNRPSFSVLSQLGMFPPDAGFDAIEVFVPCDAGPDAAKAAAERFAVPGLPVIAGSDSHFPADIGRARTVCVMKAPTFEELGLALRAVGGRSVRCA